MSTTYELRLKNHNGLPVAVFSGAGRGATGGGLQSFSYRKRLRTPGAATVRIYGNDNRVADQLLLPSGLDYQWEFWRTDPVWKPEPYMDFECFHRAERVDQTKDGRVIYLSYGTGYNALLSSENIRFAAGSAEAQKNGDATTVALEFVDENIGVSAGVDVNGDSRVRPGLTVPAVAAIGNNWQGGAANKLLSDVLFELAEYAPGDYMVLGAGAATFQFVWRNTRWGDDKTFDNSAGDPAVVFDAQLGNAQQVDSSLSFLDTVTTAYLLGQGQGSARKTSTTSDATQLALSPWARRTVSRNATDTYDDAELDVRGDETINEQRSRLEAQCVVMQTKALRYGRDWDMGDLVTLIDVFGRQANLKIVGVTISVSSGGEETITPELQAE